VIAKDNIGRYASDFFNISFQNTSGLMLASGATPSIGSSVQSNPLLAMTH
jgi:hypothetical protein